MTQTQAALWLLLGSLVWLGVGAAVLTAWGTRDELLEDFCKAVPGGEALVRMRPWVFSAALFVMAAVWPVSMRAYLGSLPGRARSRFRARRQARLDRRVRDHIERRAREFEKEGEGDA